MLFRSTNQQIFKLLHCPISKSIGDVRANAPLYDVSKHIGYEDRGANAPNNLNIRYPKNKWELTRQAWTIKTHFQIIKSTNLQIATLSHFQIYKSTNLQIVTLPHFQIYKSTNLQIVTLSHFQIYKSTNLQIVTLSHFQIYKSTNFQIATLDHC